jgi:hypothetical protein
MEVPVLLENIRPYQHMRRPVPIRPTLVVGLGDFGHAVGEQLVARLMLTEESLRGEGLTGPLLAQQEQGEISPGLVRILHLDWKRWFDEDYHPDELLRDIILADASVAESGTPPRQREEDRHPDDWVAARLALTRPRMRQVLFETASQGLRAHDNPMRVGHFQIQERKQNFEMRVIVVCALREAATTELGLDIIKLLGKVYVAQAEVAKGIHVFCYVGATGREEHFRAYAEAFGDVPEDSTEFDDLLDAELARILPVCKRLNTGQLPQDNFLDKLDQLWRIERPQTIEACYLIDSQLANRVAAVQQRSDEPDETVVATALAITMFITNNADRVVRQTRASRWDLENPVGEPGLFSTLGVASYSLDHPRLRRLVYNYVVGAFLQRAQPTVSGDDPRATLLGDSRERLPDEDYEATLTLEIQEMCSDYKKRIAFKTIAHETPSLRERIRIDFDYNSVIKELTRLSSTDPGAVQIALEDIIGELVADPGTMSGILLKHTMEQQQLYQERLESAFQELSAPLFEQEQTPLIRLYRFSKKSLEMLRGEAGIAQAPSIQADLESEHHIFTENAAEAFFNRLSERAAAIRREMANRPNMIGIAGRALLIAPALILLYSSPVISGFFAPLQAVAGSLATIFPALSHLPLPPMWAVSAFIALITWVVLSLGYRWHYHRRLRGHLSALARQFEATMQKADEEAWRWALTEELKQREPEMEYLKELCQPRGKISQLRDRLLAEKFMIRDRILERIFYDELLQSGLKKVSQNLAGNGKLWNQRGRILRELVNTKRSTRELEKWLRGQASEVYKEDSSQIIDLVESFLIYQTAQRLEAIWEDLSNAGALFLRRTTAIQDDPAVDIEMFGVHNQETIYELEAILRRTGVEVLSSVDRLRWLFMHVQTGLRLPNIKFAAESLLM